MGCVKEDFMASYPSFEFLKILFFFFTDIYLWKRAQKQIPFSIYKTKDNFDDLLKKIYRKEIILL